MTRPRLCSHRRPSLRDLTACFVIALCAFPFIWRYYVMSDNNMRQVILAAMKSCADGRKGDFVVGYQLLPEIDDVKRPLGIVVKSSAQNFALRAAIRETWGRQARQLGIPVIFAVGLSPYRKEEKNSHQEELRRERDTFEDVLQASFVDVYQNLTLKTYSILQWASRLNATETWFLVDDDTIVVPKNLLRAVRDFPPQFNTIVGHCLRGAVVQRSEKNGVTLADWPNDRWPAYCTGGAGHLLPKGVVASIVGLANQTHWIRQLAPFPEDVVFTGIFRTMASVSYQHTSAIEWDGMVKDVEPCDRTVISQHEYKRSDDLKAAWLLLERKFVSC